MAHITTMNRRLRNNLPAVQSVRLRTLQTQNYWSKSPDISLQNKGIHCTRYSMKVFQKISIGKMMEADIIRIMSHNTSSLKYLVLVIWPFDTFSLTFTMSQSEQWHPPAQKTRPEKPAALYKSHCCEQMAGAQLSPLTGPLCPSSSSLLALTIIYFVVCSWEECPVCPK